MAHEILFYALRKQNSVIQVQRIYLSDSSTSKSDQIIRFHSHKLNI
jgi:hypothetical protein